MELDQGWEQDPQVPVPDLEEVRVVGQAAAAEAQAEVAAVEREREAVPARWAVPQLRKQTFSKSWDGSPNLDNPLSKQIPPSK